MITQIEIAGANFRTDEKSDGLNSEFMERLGMRKRYLPARLAIAKSLAMPNIPDQLEDGNLTGKSIKGDTLFGTGPTFISWIALLVEHSGQFHLDTRTLVSLVGAHWRRGIQILDKRWINSNENLTVFLKGIIDESDLPLSGSKKVNKVDSTSRVAKNFKNSTLVSVPIGEISEDVDTGEKVAWELNGQGGSPHCAIMGGVGSGKTRSAVAMLKSIKEQVDIPLIAFDFKGDLGTDSSGGGYHIDDLYSAQIIEPPREPIPLDVLALNERDEISLNEAASHFRESFTRLKTGRLGNIQKSAIHEAASRAFELFEVCEISNIKDELIRIYEEKEIKHDGAVATMEEICRFPLFKPTLKPREFFDKSWIIKIPPNVAEDSRTIVVNLILNALDQHLNGLPDSKYNSDGSRSLRILCLIDEAHKILSTKLPALSSLIRMSRSKGGSIMLISQSPDDFSGEDDEFLSEMGLVAAFSTNAPPKNATRILGKGTKLSNLQTGQCYVKARGNQSTIKVESWINQR